MIRDRKTGTLINPFGPLEAENFQDALDVKFIKAYQRMRAYPRGETRIDVKHDVRTILGHNWGAADWILRFSDMERLGMIHWEHHFSEKGRLEYMHITVRDRDSIPEHLSRVNPGKSTYADALRTLLYSYEMLYQRQTKHVYTRYGKDISMAKKVLEKCSGDAHEAVRLATAFFSQPLEMRPDDFSFRSFYYSIDKMLATQRTDELWEQARREGARAAAERDVGPTEEEVKVHHEEALRNLAEIAKRRAFEVQLAARDAEDNAL